MPPSKPTVLDMLWSHIVDICRMVGRNPAVYRFYRKHPALKKLNQKPAPSVSVASAFVSEEQFRQEEQLRTVFAETILLLARHRVRGWWDYFRDYSLFRFRDAGLLRLMLRIFVLRRAGDYKAFLRLSDRLDSIADNVQPEDHFARLVALYYGGALKQARNDFTALKSQIDAQGKRAFLIGFPVWGDAFINAFFTSALPSLMAEGNLPKLCRERQVVLLIHTDEASRARFSAAPQMQALERMGVVIRYAMLDATLLLRMKEVENNKYWHLGMIQSLQLYAAQSLNADYHIMLPDTLYGNSYFTSLLSCAKQSPVILQTALRADESIMESMEPYRQGSAISVPAADLMALALNHSHSANQPVRPESEPPRWPAFHGLLWEGEHEVHFISPHQTIAYLDQSLIAALPERFYFTLDSEIDKFIPEDFTVSHPCAADGLALIEVSPGGGSPPPLVEVEEFCRIFWHRIESEKHLRFFNGDITFPINRRLRKGDSFRTREAIERDKAFIRDAVRAHLPAPLPDAVLNGFLCLHAAEAHSAAAGAFDDLHEAARTIWEEHKNAVGIDSSLPTASEIARLLWHFDLLPEAAQFLTHFPRLQPLASFVRDVLADQGESATWARAWRSAAGEAKEVHVLGITVWGEEYLKFLLEYHFPCLLAPGNLPALANEGKVIISIVTDERGMQRIMGHPVYPRLEKFAEFHFIRFAQAPKREDGPADFYRRYGVFDHHHVYLARALAANLFLMPADCVFGGDVFLRLLSHLSSGHDACAVACIEVYKDKVQATLDAVRKDGVLALDGKWLLALGAQHKSDYFRSLVFDPRVTPNAHPREFFWRVKGGYACHSIFMHPLALSHRALSRPFHPNHENVDWALLPRLLQNSGLPKIISDASEVAIVHCSNREVRAGDHASYHYEANWKVLQYLLSVHKEDFALHRHCLRTAQFFPCEDAEFPVSSTYSADIAYLLQGFTPLGEHAAKKA